ncbi:MAG: DUF3135 domain-containing protein [Patescibacteria group bacterium]|mgnify:FL=1
MSLTGNDSNFADQRKFFEYWFNLAKSDPDLFESERKAEIEKVISKAPPEHQRGLRQLQWVIDGERNKAKNPIDAMVRLNKMMWVHFYGKNGFVALLCSFDSAVLGKCVNKLGSGTATKNAVILPFKKD